jgi:predicted ribosomally synthesized peptide with nif11-like leader
MTNSTVTEFIQAVEQDASLKAKITAAVDLETRCQIAAEYGYQITAAELQAEASQQPQEDLAEMTNPGMAPRKHLGAQ